MRSNYDHDYTTELASPEEVARCLALHERNEVAENWKSLAKTYLFLAVLGALVSGVEAATIAVLVLR